MCYHNYVYFSPGGERIGTPIDREFFRIRLMAIPHALFLLHGERLLLPTDATTLNLGIAIPEVSRTVPAIRRPQALQSAVEQMFLIGGKTHGV